MSANVIVPAGTLVHVNAGETAFGSAIVYFTGITPPSSNEVVVNVSPGPAAGRAAGCAGVWANAGAPIASASAAAITVFEIIKASKRDDNPARLTMVNLWVASTIECV